ncbi:FkbM family methyltransferase [bacterium]|nr:FkbM family methyltransferase [bacterium]
MLPTRLYAPARCASEQTQAFCLWPWTSGGSSRTGGQRVSRTGGQRDGFFIEIGGNDGLRASNTVFSEACLGWRGLLIEANPVSFGLLRANRPDVLALSAAICARHGTEAFVTRTSRGAARRGFVRPAVDETGGLVSTLSAAAQNDFEGGRAAGIGPDGRRVRRSAIATWAESSGAGAGAAGREAMQIRVPCGPLHAHLELLRVRRVDVFWLDTEGADVTFSNTPVAFRTRSAHGCTICVPST